MNSDHIGMIKNLVQLIEEDIREDIDLDLLAEKTGFSKFYIHRLFKALTGQSLMTYVRGRRLSLSLNELVNTRLNMIDIAQEYRFSHEQSYIRAFKQQFGVTPAHYRRMHCEMPVVEKLDTARLYGAQKGLMTAPRMCIMPAFYLQGIQQEIVHDHNYYYGDTNKQVEAWAKNYLPNIQNKVDETVYFGLVMYNAPKGDRLYAACTQVKACAEAEAPVKSYAIPTRNYAAFKYVGMHSPYEISFKVLLELYQKINEWKSETSFIQSDGFHIERVDLKKCDENYCEMDIYVPVKTNKK